MNPRRAIGALLFASFALLAGACSGSDDADETTTTKKETTTTEAADSEDSDDSETTDTVSDEEFDAVVGEAASSIEAASGDACTLFTAFTDLSAVQLPDPSTPAQVETAVGLLDTLLSTIANTAPPEFAAEADALNNAVTTFNAAAEENDYSPEWFSSSDADPFSDPETSAALDAYLGTVSQQCAPETTETTVAG
jgi:hypothetical protein